MVKLTISIETAKRFFVNGGKNRYLTKEIKGNRMTGFETSWTKEDLRTYLLIYCANADFHESKVEIDFIRSQTVDADFDQLHEEYNGDSDFQRIQKIRLAVKRFNYSKSELDALFAEINNLMSADKSKDILNENFVRELHHILG